MSADQDSFAPWDIRDGRDRPQPFRSEAVELSFVMDDGTEGVEVVPTAEEMLRPGDGADDAPAEAGPAVDFDRHHDRAGASRMPNLPWMTPSTHTSSSWRVMWVLSITKASSGWRRGEVSRWESI